MLFQDGLDKNDFPQSEQSSIMKSITSSSVSSGPIAIPGSPARPSPSRQSSQDSFESLEEGEDGMFNKLIIWYNSIYIYF